MQTTPTHDTFPLIINLTYIRFISMHLSSPSLTSGAGGVC